MYFFVINLPFSSSGKDIAFSRQEHGFDSRKGYLVIRASIV